MKRAALGLSLLVLAGCGLVLAGCGSTSSAGGGSLNVVAAENFWGSIATQIAGSKASVHNIIVNPATDPHSYESTAQDGRTLATAQLAIVNGLGYDPWAAKLLASNPLSGRIVLTVGDLLGLHEGANPHRWYDPADVLAVAKAISVELGRLDPKDASYFNHQLQAFETTGLAQYNMLIKDIKTGYAGVPVGASESILALLTPALGLKLLTPYSFMKAISEGTDPSAQDIVAIQRQISTGQIKAWIYNSQNATPQIQHLNQLARTRGIAVATVTETLDPPNVSFQQWQASQLARIAQALHQATRR